LGPAVLRRGISLLSDIFALAPPMVKPELALDGKLVEVKGSMLFRFAYGASKFIPKGARFRKARKGIDRAIRQEGIFHLWFHPISFAYKTPQMFEELEKILEYAYKKRQDRQLKILTLQEVGDTYLNKSRDTDRFNPRAIVLHDRKSSIFKKDYSDDLADYYSNAFKYGRKKIESAFLGFLGNLNGGGHILDVGCGTGYFLNLMRKRRFNCTGIDISENMLLEARKNFSDLPVQLADARKLPFKDNSFDAVISIETLRYFSKRDSLVKEIYRVTKPGGKIFITAAPLFSVNSYGLFNTICRLFNLKLFVSCFQSFETANSLKKHLIKSGFKDVSIKGYFLGPYFLLDKIYPKLSSYLMRKLEWLDEALTKCSLARNFSNHLVAIARKP
jgi:ubiquinone/menaquinone biosynthesis C-methylase UbiE